MEVIRAEPLSTYLENWKAPTSVVTGGTDTIYLSGLPPVDPQPGQVVDAPIERQTKPVSNEERHMRTNIPASGSNSAENLRVKQRGATTCAGTGAYQDLPASVLRSRYGQVLDQGRPIKSGFTGTPEALRLDRIATPVGTALLVTDEAGALRALDFQDYESRMRRLLGIYYGTRSLVGGAAPAEIRGRLQRYFDGELDALRNIAWAIAGTPFQQTVWAALVGIPCGQTMSYGELAQQLGIPRASRAVGWANGSNPIAIVVPCHRVIGATGKLTGYAGGLHRKQWLLRHEGARFAGETNLDLFSNCDRCD